MKKVLQKLCKMVLGAEDLIAPWMYCLDDDASDSRYYLPDPTLVEAVCVADAMTVDARPSMPVNENINMETYSLEVFLLSGEADKQHLIDEDEIESPTCINGTPDLKVPHVAGSTTPFLTVQTPATKDGVVVKKSRCIMGDHSTIISNKRFGKQLADWSQLKREQKTPLSAKLCYQANRTHRTNIFLMPLIQWSLDNIVNLNDELLKNPEQVECLETPANSFEANDPSMSEDQEFDMNLVNEMIISLLESDLSQHKAPERR